MSGKNVRILGIETSCDETAAAIVENGYKVLASVVKTQIDLHKVYGGIVPEIACRSHIEVIIPIIDEVLLRSNLKLEKIDAIAVTNSPGLVGALLVGVSVAKALAVALAKPLIAVNHVEAHIYANNIAGKEMKYPCICLAVSGGHTTLFISDGPTKMIMLGSTIDDAAGEAFDKVAKILGLPFPGGPSIEKSARLSNKDKIKFRRTSLSGFDFSFSGIKTAVLYYVCGQNAQSKRTLAPIDVSDIAFSFQEAMVDMLISKIIKASEKYHIKNIAIGGGVSSNSRLREKLLDQTKNKGYVVYIPPKELCTDNAEMVAGIAYHLYNAERFSDMYLDAVPTKFC